MNAYIGEWITGLEVDLMDGERRRYPAKRLGRQNYSPPERQLGCAAAG
jgi:hypothetical protein